MNPPNDFQATKQAELDRWTKWWRGLSDLANRSLHVVDVLEKMDAETRERPTPYSAEEAAGIAGQLLPLVVEMAEHGASPGDAAQLLREAANRIED